MMAKNLCIVLGSENKKHLRVSTQATIDKTFIELRCSLFAFFLITTMTKL